jgi:hypothetical protein
VRNVVKVGSGHVVCVCVGGSCEGIDLQLMVATLMQTLHEHHLSMFNLIKIIFFDVRVKMTFVLTLTIRFNTSTLSNFQGIVCTHVTRNMG